VNSPDGLAPAFHRDDLFHNVQTPRTVVLLSVRKVGMKGLSCKRVEAASAIWDPHSSLADPCIFFPDSAERRLEVAAARPVPWS
jgi:hypothetical protein